MKWEVNYGVYERKRKGFDGFTSLRYDKVEMNGLETGTERCVEKQRQILMHEGDLCVGLSFISMQQNTERGDVELAAYI